MDKTPMDILRALLQSSTERYHFAIALEESNKSKKSLQKKITDLSMLQRRIAESMGKLEGKSSIGQQQWVMDLLDGRLS
jgi:stress-induced morphogen